MKLDLTEKAILRLPLPPAGAGPKDYTDIAVPQLKLTIRSNGSRSWTMRYRVGDDPADRQQRRLTIGEWPEITTEDARVLALGARKLLRDGIDPVEWEAQRRRAEAEKRRAEAELNFARLAERFIRHQHREGRRSWVEQARILGLLVTVVDPVTGHPEFERKAGGLAARWADRPLASIERLDVTAALDELTERGLKQAAVKRLAVVKSFFSWALNAGYVTASPVQKMKGPKASARRERYLNDAELRWLWQAAEAEDYPRRQFVHLLILSAQRRNEVAGMRYAEIRGDVWYLPAARSKNKHDHAIPLSAAALDAIKSALRHLSGVVLTCNGSRPFGDFDKLKRRLDERMAKLAGPGVTIAPWHFHDLRHTALTGMARLGVRPDVISQVANHRSVTAGTVTTGYVHYDWLPEKRDALERWASHVAAIVGAEPAVTPEVSNVVSLTG